MKHQKLRNKRMAYTHYNDAMTSAPNNTRSDTELIHVGQWKASLW